jgi:hypothetical protein
MRAHMLSALLTTVLPESQSKPCCWWTLYHVADTACIARHATMDELGRHLEAIDGNTGILTGSPSQIQNADDDGRSVLCLSLLTVSQQPHDFHH